MQIKSKKIIPYFYQIKSLNSDMIPDCVDLGYLELVGVNIICRFHCLEFLNFYSQKVDVFRRILSFKKLNN